MASEITPTVLEETPITPVETCVIQEDPPTVQIQLHNVCGGIGNSRPVTNEDLEIWNMYKESSESKIRTKFQLPEGFVLQPIQVATQVVSGINYFFKVELPDKKYATVRITHVSWQKDTYGKASHVAVSEKLADNSNDNAYDFYNPSN